MELIAALEAYCCDVTLATMGAPLCKAQRAEVHQLRNVDLRESTYRLEWMQDCWEDVGEAGEWLLELAAEQEFDVVHLNNYCHGDLGWPCPVLMVGHSCVWSWYHAVRGRAPGQEWTDYFQRVRQGLRAAQLVVAPTHYMLDQLQQFYGPLGDCEVIANGRQGDHFQPGTKEPFLLAAGRLWDEAKNVQSLCRAAGQVDWPVHLAGECCHPDGGSLDLPDVKCLGHLSRDELAGEMSRASIYALPARYEPFGLSALEAALSGCCLVLGEIPSLHEVWGSSALYVDPTSDLELAETLQRLIHDRHLRCRYATRARERALHLDPQWTASSYYEAYVRLAGSMARHDSQLTTIRTAFLPPREAAARCAS